jgi:glycosyltransferase involved in cell wall biosynthesis
VPAPEWPSVTVITPAHNSERFLGEAIESTFDQGYPELEMVVVDDGSTDRTAEIAFGRDGVRVIGQRNEGPGPARNAGIAASSGEVIALLDSDDVMLPGRLQTQVGHLVDHPEVAAVIGRQRLMVEPGVRPPAWIVAQSAKPGEASGFSDDLSFSGVHVTSTLVTWRRVYDAVGPYDPAFREAEDVDWLMRVMDAGMRVSTIDEELIGRRMHGANMVTDLEAVRRGLFKAMKARIDRRRARSAADAQ